MDRIDYIKAKRPKQRNQKPSDKEKDMKMQPLRVLTVPRLLAINAVVAGLEIAACVAFTFIPPLLLKVTF